MSWIFALLSKLVPVLDSTEKLVRAVKESIKPPPEPPPPIGQVAAQEFLRGHHDKAWEMMERERLRKQADELAKKAKEDPDPWSSL